MENKKILACLVFALSAPVFAGEENGFYGGIGSAATANSDCGSFCDTSGYGFEAGYAINKFFDVEIKQNYTSFDNEYGGDVETTAIGVNGGTGFGTSWFKLYAKVGYQSTTQAGYGDDANPFFGVGVRFTPIASQKGLYIKIESTSSTFFEDNVGGGYLGIGYQF